MGLISGLLGNASELAPTEVQRELQALLSPGEVVEKAYKVIRDSFIFTDRRLILIDVQGLTGSKIEYQSVPYRSIVRFAVETAGSFDLDAELKIWVTGGAAPFQFQFNRKVSIYEVQAVLASYVTR